MSAFPLLTGGYVYAPDLPEFLKAPPPITHRELLFAGGDHFKRRVAEIEAYNAWLELIGPPIIVATDETFCPVGRVENPK